MGKNKKVKAKGFKRVISKFKRLVTEDEDYYNPDAAILKPINRKQQDQNQLVVDPNEELESLAEPMSIMEAFEDFQANNSLVVDDLVRNLSQSLSTSVQNSLSLSAANSYSDSVATSEPSLQDTLWENDSLEVSSQDSLAYIVEQSDEGYLVGQSSYQDAPLSASTEVYNDSNEYNEELWTSENSDAIHEVASHESTIVSSE